MKARISPKFPLRFCFLHVLPRQRDIIPLVLRFASRSAWRLILGSRGKPVQPRDAAAAYAKGRGDCTREPPHVGSFLPDFFFDSFRVSMLR